MQIIFESIHDKMRSKHMESRTRNDAATQQIYKKITSVMKKKFMTIDHNKT